jgi:hypothetical protein
MTSVIIMGLGLEFSKIVSALWVHKNWKNPNVSAIIKSYLCVAIVVLMLITDIGVFGYLSKSHLDNTAPVQTIKLQIDALEQKITSDQKTIDRDNQQLAELDKSLDVYLKNDKPTKALKARADQKPERDRLTKELVEAQKDIDTLQAQETPLKQQMADVAQKLGPIKYVAALFYNNPTQDQIDNSVRLMILTIMIVFDPLAIILVVSAGISLTEYFDKKKQMTQAVPVVAITATTKDEIKPGPAITPVASTSPPVKVSADPSYLEKKFKAMYDKYIPNKPK